VLCFVFFFQAEDGIRDFHVTGVQTCALPICTKAEVEHWLDGFEAEQPALAVARLRPSIFLGPQGRRSISAFQRWWFPYLGDGKRSEERRVGKERRAGGAAWRDNTKEHCETGR